MSGASDKDLGVLIPLPQWLETSVGLPVLSLRIARARSVQRQRGHSKRRRHVAGACSPKTLRTTRSTPRRGRPHGSRGASGLGIEQATRRGGMATRSSPGGSSSMHFRAPARFVCCRNG